ncbi:hypothetical protein [Cohnella fermenti]|uniref:Uncharacterized protein n=1 Tax=Cohnella fermenti TaxID=2565925 RepID=A0A4S4BIC3_9BACL|nr:hypothetical protein [Cohnella fermenti]THF74361.1 hypothetical protein E6C55_25290 [Cohnella fermenti]
MPVRILHCGESIESYNICLEQQLVGFTKRVGQPGDLVYIAVRQDGRPVCGARGKLHALTDERPWPDSDVYPQCFSLIDVEYCAPFDIRFLEQIGGRHWVLKYVQSSKAITEPEAVHLLDSRFSEHKQEQMQLLDVADLAIDADLSDSSVVEADLPGEDPDNRVQIIGTYSTVKFKDEKDPMKGLEPLVNRHFYRLFEAFDETHSLLIPENRMFVTSAPTGSKKTQRFRTIPDALLINYTKEKSVPLQINLIEYECFGLSKSGSTQKFKYLNEHMIPQLIRFASTFSVVTITEIRQKTIKTWVDKVIAFIQSNEFALQRITSWLQEIDPSMKEHSLLRNMDKQLTQAFRSRIQIMLVIDELSAEQRKMIKSVIESFLLENEKSISFLSYIVQLHQRMSGANDNEYVLSVQT